MTTRDSPWICCQLGAREHYAVARALASRGALTGLITEAWVPPGSQLAHLSARLAQRFHPALAPASVRAWNARSVVFELRGKLTKTKGWSQILKRNEWFQRQALRHLESHASDFRPLPSGITLFSYSYTALELFRFAKARGWRTVLGQIDPGLHEERIVQRLFELSGGELGGWTPAPPEYWRLWREECALADTIIVNSEWSRQGLLSEGVPPNKLRVVPLAFEGESGDEHATFRRVYPERFTASRPLRVLFLGQINLRKGVGPLLDAVRLLTSKPVEFWFVGPVQIQIPDDLVEAPNIRWIGPVSRQVTATFYRDADLFIFPTLSDGFGLTQLEAQSWSLPVVASRCCGEVVQHGINGLLLDEVDASSIASAVQTLLTNPERLKAMATNSKIAPCFCLESLASCLVQL